MLLMEISFMKYMKTYLILTIFSSFMSTNNGVMKDAHAGGQITKVFYESFSGYSIPLNLINIIPEEEIHAKKSYYIGSYNELDQLLLVEKIDSSVVSFRHTYFYYTNGELRKRIVLNSDGNEFSHSYDENGNLLE